MEPSLRPTAGLELHEVDWNRVGGNFELLPPGQTFVYESRLILADGQKLPVEIYIRRVVVEKQEYLQWLVRDLTERKTLDKMRNDLSSMIYHDLRSPLSNIISSLDILSTMLPMEENPTIGSVFSVAQRSADRLQRLISSLLDISRLEAGQSIIRPRHCLAQSLVFEARDVVLPSMEAREQSLKVDLPVDLPALMVDTEMIRRVLVNLLENASKFTPLHGQLFLGGRTDGDWVTIWVQDTGPGIPEESREYIFEKFARLQGERNVKGLGIGLAFCRLAVQAHGGRIWVESQPGAGSRFLFTLPLDRTTETISQE
jgi:NtrC-family two-component system sensor histidine kinase KinB